MLWSRLGSSDVRLHRQTTSYWMNLKMFLPCISISSLWINTIINHGYFFSNLLKFVTSFRRTFFLSPRCFRRPLLSFLCLSSVEEVSDDEEGNELGEKSDSTTSFDELPATVWVSPRACNSGVDDSWVAVLKDGVGSVGAGRGMLSYASGFNDRGVDTMDSNVCKRISKSWSVRLDIGKTNESSFTFRSALVVARQNGQTNPSVPLHIF